MAEDFFADLGETLSRTAKDISNKADDFFESQKIRTKIMTEQRMIDKAMSDIGNIIYKKYVDGGAVSEDVTELCEDITQRKVAIAKYRESVSKMKGEKICPSCGASVPSDAAFCMKCGTACPDEEPEEEAVTQEPPEEPETQEEKVASEGTAQAAPVDSVDATFMQQDVDVKETERILDEEIK